MGNEASQPDGALTPISDYNAPSVVSDLGPVRAPPPVIRRGSRSQASSAQHSPVDAPEVDLSHLSDQERAQIVSVMARARQLQEEENQRLR